jgi:hypothetical protein
MERRSNGPQYGTVPTLVWETKENHAKADVEQPSSRTRFELETCRIWNSDTQRLSFSEIWRRVISYSVPDFSKEHSTFETSGTDYPETRRHTPEGLNPQLHRRKTAFAQW